MALHIIKLCVGCDTVEDLVTWRKANGGDADWHMHTRMTPKRIDEILDGGSLYRVFKGMVLARQKILAIETVGEGQAARCQVLLDPELVRVAPVPRRPFQGWRYLKAEEAPPDLEAGADAGAMPTELAVKLRELGAW